MGNAIGACMGTIAGSCIIKTSSGGDFSSSSRLVTNTLDTALVFIPLFVWLLKANILVVPLMMATAIVNLGMAFVDDPRRLYGLRLITPIGIALAASAATVYWNFDLLANMSQRILIFSTISFSTVTTTCFADIGFRMNRVLRQSFDRIYHMYWLLVVYQTALIIACCGLLYWSLELLGLYIPYCLAVAGLVLLAVWDFETRNGERGSIMSATLVVVGSILIACKQIPFHTVIPLVAVYNNFFLHDDDKRMDDKLPLISTVPSTPPQYYEWMKYVLNFFIAFAQLLVVVDSLPMKTEEPFFLGMAYFLYVWITIAPVVMKNRIFTLVYTREFCVLLG